MTDKEKAIILGIISHSYKKYSKKGFTLPTLANFTKEICDELNKIPFSVKYDLPDIKNKNQELLVCEENKECEVWKVFKKVEDPLKKENIQPVEKIYTYKDLPCDYVRFSRTVILKALEEKKAKDCLGSILEGLDLVIRFDPMKERLLELTEPICSYSDDVKKALKDLEQICALSARFFIDKRPQSGTDNRIWYELLQNANDHIFEGGNHTLKVTISKEEISLEYSDEGFSVRDFFAISTNGNSANVLENNKEREGRKGTGFKRVYDEFREVIVESGEVKCIFRDKPVNFSLESNCIKWEYKGEWDKGEKTYYPIPKFEKLTGDEIKNKRTKITLRQPVYYEEFLKDVFPGCQDDKYKEAFINSKVFLFLNKIAKYEFEIEVENKKEPVKFEFDRETYISKNYEEYTGEFNVGEDLLEKNSYWKEKKGTNVFKKKQRIDFLFPRDENEIFEKKQSEDEDKIEIKIKPKKLYCTLPISGADYAIPFYMNIPLLELEEGRNKLKENGNMDEWNKGILELALCSEGEKESCFSQVFKKFSSENKEDAYKYFPYEYCKKGFEKVTWKSTLEKIPFIQTTKNGTDFKLYSLSQWAKMEDIDNKDADCFVFLSNSMYKWFEESKKCDFSCEIPYVYYKTEGNLKKLHNILKPFYVGNEDYVREHFKREKEGQVGKIPLQISEYLETKAKELAHKGMTDKENFHILLKKILKNENEFMFANRLYRIYNIFFLANGFKVVDNDCKYQCINNSNLETGKFIEINGYKSVEPLVELLRKNLYDNNEKWESEEIKMIKTVFYFNSMKLLQSPFIEYSYKWNKDEKKYNENVELKNEPEELNELEKLDNYDVIAELSKELLKVQWSKESEAKIKKWIKEGKIYGKDSEQKITKLSGECYYCEDEKFHGKNIFTDKVYKDYLKSLQKEITEGFFYYDNGEELVKKILVSKMSYVEGLQKALSSEMLKKLGKEKKERVPFLLKTLLEKKGEGVSWIKEYEEYIVKLDGKDLIKDKDSVAFRFEKNDLIQLPIVIRDNFKRKVSSKEREAEKEWENLNLPLSEIVEKKIYVKECPIGNKRLYCYGKYNNDRVIVLFGENSFGKVLKEVYECSGYSENKSYDDMTSNVAAGIFENGITPRDLNDSEKEKVDKEVSKIIDVWEGKNGKEYLISRLISCFEVKAEGNTWIKAKGYGMPEREYLEKKCPLCGSVLIAEKSVLNLSYVTYVKKSNNCEKNIHLPVFICDNCNNAFKYAKAANVNIDEDSLKLGNTGSSNIKVFFDMCEHDGKEIDMQVSFLNRWIWHKIIEVEDKA